MGTWRPTRPSSTDDISDIPSLTQDNFEAIEDAFGVEHHTLTSPTLSGTHKYASVVKIGTTAEIASIPSPPNGALAYDTTKGVLLQYHSATGWERIGKSKWSRCAAYPASGMVITAGAPPSPIIWDTIIYDTNSELNSATGVFTAKTQGVYVVVASVALAASGTLISSKTSSATANDVVTWTPVGSANWANIIDWETPCTTDTDYNVTNILNRTDVFSGSSIPLTGIPETATNLSVSVYLGSRAVGCTCNNVCYGYSSECTCYNLCYSESCTCDMTCYSYRTCHCNMTCYTYWKIHCHCNMTCYGYIPCWLCNYQRYGHSCSCYNTCYQQGASGCGCDSTCYNEVAALPAGVLKIGTNTYAGDPLPIEKGDFKEYVSVWENDPSTGLDWTPSSIANIVGWGYKLVSQSSETNGCSAQVAWAYLRAVWSPIRPVVTLGLYKNDSLLEAKYAPLHEAGTQSNQTIQLFTVVPLEVGDTLQIKLAKSDSSDNLIADSRYTFLAIHRLTGAIL